MLSFSSRWSPLSRVLLEIETKHATPGKIYNGCQRTTKRAKKTCFSSSLREKQFSPKIATLYTDNFSKIKRSSLYLGTIRFQTTYLRLTPHFPHAHFPYHIFHTLILHICFFSVPAFSIRHFPCLHFPDRNLQPAYSIQPNTCNK